MYNYQTGNYQLSLKPGPAVQKVKNAIYWINLYLVDSPIVFSNGYLLESDLISLLNEVKICISKLVISYGFLFITCIWFVCLFLEAKPRHGMFPDTSTCETVLINIIVRYMSCTFEQSPRLLAQLAWFNSNYLRICLASWILHVKIFWRNCHHVNITCTKKIIIT